MGRRRGVSAGIAVLVIAFVAPGCSSVTSESGEPEASRVDACSVLSDSVPLRPFAGDPPPGFGDADTLLEVPLHAALAPGGRNMLASMIVIYLDVGDEADLDRWADQVQSRPGVHSVEVYDLDKSYEEFRRLFSGQPEMLEAVRPEDLPTSVWAETDDAATAQALEEWARAEDGIYEVMVRGPEDPSWEMQFWGLDSEVDRSTWREEADRLDAVDGSPEWATAYADLVREVIEVGPARVKGSDSMEQADLQHPALHAAMDGCGL